MFSKFGFNVADKYGTLSELSGGQLTKIAFIKLLLIRPDIMILDEPTNHLDMQTIEWLEDYLKKYKKAVVVVSHDRMFLDKVCDVVYEIEYKTARRYLGNYSDFVARKQLDYEAAQQKEIERLKTLVNELPALGGSFKYGFQIEYGYFDQHMAQYTGSKTVLDDFWDEFPTLT